MGAKGKGGRGRVCFWVPSSPAIGHPILSMPGGLREHGLGRSERHLGNQSRLLSKTMKFPSAESRLQILF